MAPLKDLVANVDCFCEQEHERPCDNDRAFPKRPMESENTNPTGRRPFCGAIECRKLIRFAPAKSLIRQIDSLELLLRFLLKPDIIRESIGMPYFRLIMVCLSYLCNRRPRLNLENPTIAVVIAHRIHGSSFLSFIHFSEKHLHTKQKQNDAAGHFKRMHVNADRVENDLADGPGGHEDDSG